MKEEVKLVKSPNPKKKWRVIFKKNGKHVDFGQKGYSDFTIHKNLKRMRLYVHRHSGMGETWTLKGLKTAGFWSRWLLWSKHSLENAKKYIKSKFNIQVR
jgi:hypothetical protein